MAPQIPHKLCPRCRNAAPVDALLCVRCGHQFRTALPVHRTQYVNVPAPYRRPQRSRALAVIWALFFGGLGAHKFYLGETWQGVAYLLFCWTLVPAFVAVIDAVVLLLMREYTFEITYNPDGSTWP